MRFPAADLTIHLFRMSAILRSKTVCRCLIMGHNLRKLVTGTESITPQCSSVCSPSTEILKCFRTQLWAPSHPKTYFALTTVLALPSARESYRNLQSAGWFPVPKRLLIDLPVRDASRVGPGEGRRENADQLTYSPRIVEQWTILC
jgi:hypothetical protein